MEAVTVIGANLAAAASALPYTGSWVPAWQQTDGRAHCKTQTDVIYIYTVTHTYIYSRNKP